MEQVEPIRTTEEAIFPPGRQDPRWDPEKATKRKVRVIKVPYDQDPMKEKTIFEYQGFVYICYSKKTRGRSMIRCLGISQVEVDPKIMDPGPAAKGLKDAIDDQVMKEAIESEGVQKVIKGVVGDGQSRGPDETPYP